MIHSLVPPAVIAPLRVFVVDDDHDTLLAVRRYVEQLGHEVTWARSLLEAVDGLTRTDAHVLITDLLLPDGSGWELLEHAQRERPIFAILMTISDSHASQTTSRLMGFRHHLVKPCGLLLLDHILQEAALELRA